MSKQDLDSDLKSQLKKKQNYYHIKYYNEKFEKLKRQGVVFEVTSTGYTKKITTLNEVMFFNETGGDDPRMLRLIAAVRNDAKQYLATHSHSDFYETETDFFGLLDVINNEEVIVKIDVKAAYWEAALKSEVISYETNEKFKEWYKDTDVKYAKQARLKALGSLATSKITNVYKKGKFNYGKKPQTELTKEIYMAVCNKIDRLMKDCNYEVGGCKYYYWDCIFVQKEFENEVIEFIKNSGYDISSVEETKLDFIVVGDVGYLRSTSDGKIYMTKKENKQLLNFEDDN